MYYINRDDFSYKVYRQLRLRVRTSRYKDIEKHCTQNKISFMIVKDLLAGIIADNLLETEKIGSSAFYWSLPKRVYDAKKNLSGFIHNRRSP